MKNLIKFAIVLIVLVILFCASSCGGMRPQSFEGSSPQFTLEDYFAGRTKAWGVVHDRSDQLVRQFSVDMLGEWDGEQLTLTEDFLYSDGEREQRIWRIRKIDEHHYEGRADDVDGIAKGYQYGQALYWTYTLNLKVDDSTYKVHFDDWMYLQPDGVLINRAVFSKFGIRFGEVILFFQKQ